MTDAIFVKGTLLTQDETNHRAEALAVEWGRISAIGAREDIENLARPGRSSGTPSPFRRAVACNSHR